MPKVSWTNEFYVRIYCGAKEGLSNTQIAKQLGVAKITFKKWVKKDAAVRDALKSARSPVDDEGAETFTEYVYKHLPKNLKQYWDDINSWSNHPNAKRRMDALFEKTGQKVRQGLFVHAMVSSNFNASMACRKVGISKTTLDLWKADPFFTDLLDQVAWHKENFVEGSLFKLIKAGDTSAILFANKTLNAPRGYGTKAQEFNVNVKGQVTHGILDLNKLELPVKLRMEIMQHVEKIRLQEEKDTEESQRQPRVALPVHMETNDED